MFEDMELSHSEVMQGVIKVIAISNRGVLPRRGEMPRSISSSAYDALLSTSADGSHDNNRITSLNNRKNQDIISFCSLFPSTITLRFKRVACMLLF